MMHHMHTGEAVVTSQKIDIFLLVINVGSKLFFLLVSSDTSTVGSYFQPGEHRMTIILEFFASFS